MRIGLVEFLLILAIAALTIGPSAALWVERWMRRAQKTSAAAARRRAAQEAQRAAEREAVLRRFQKLSIVFVLCAAAALVWGLVLRPIDVAVTPYTAPALRQSNGTPRTLDPANALTLNGYRDISCIRKQDDWLYLSAQQDTRTDGAVLLRVREDGSGLSVILTAEGEITGFDFDPEGSIWYTTVTADGGALCRVRSDDWGAAAEQIVTQIDGTALHCPTAVAAASDGTIYFTDAAAVSTRYGTEGALRTELIAHTGTGSVYAYDPAARTVQQVLGGISGASGLTLDADGQTLYAADLGSRCIWAVDANAREVTAGGKHCTAIASGLPGYPGALAADADGMLLISYRWSRSGWLEAHTDSALLRGAALRLSHSMQEGLFSLSADTPALEALSLRDGSWGLCLSGQGSGSLLAVCPAGSRLYLTVSGASELCWAKI